jgi:hypothetical protein
MFGYWNSKEKVWILVYIAVSQKNNLRKGLNPPQWKGYEQVKTVNFKYWRFKSWGLGIGSLQIETLNKQTDKSFWHV